jgi:CelD/BcsL family acetyltransferase involved in cellulose biosynthesis
MLATLPAAADVRERHVEAASCSTEVVTDYDAFLDLEAAWNDAVVRARVPHPFLRHEWVRTWWECFGAGRRLHIVVIRRGGLIAAIAPLMWESTRMYGLRVRQLRLLQNDHTPRTDILIVDHPADSYRAIWNALLDCQESWDLVLLNQVPTQSPTRDTLFAHAAAKDFPTGVWPSNQSPYLELPGTWDTYYASLSSKFKQNLRNRLSRLNQLGDAALELIQDGTDIRSCCEDAWRLEDSGWKREEGTAITSDPAVKRFYTLLAERAALHGWLRLLFLTVNGRRIATSYGSIYRDRLFLFKTGYDTEFAKCAPFKLLTYLAAQEAFKQGLSEVDFLGDAEPWKLEWTSTTRDHEWLFIFSNTSRGRLLHRAKFQLLPAVKRWRG